MGSSPIDSPHRGFPKYPTTSPKNRLPHRLTDDTNAAIATDDLVGFNLVKLAGVTSVTDGMFVAGNFDFVT